MVNKRYKQILVDAEEFLEHVDADEFLDTFLELQENCSAPTIEDFNNKEIPPWNHDVIRIGRQNIID